MLTYLLDTAKAFDRANFTTVLSDLVRETVKNIMSAFAWVPTRVISM